MFNPFKPTSGNAADQTGADLAPGDGSDGTGRGDRGVGKGRPTPTRKEAEAAARAKAKAPRTRKEIAAARRKANAEGSSRMREAMRTGDERYLPARDRGRVRRFIRDYVDVKFSFIELMMPAVLLSLALSLSRNLTAMGIGNWIFIGALMLAIVDGFFLHVRLRKELKTRFPDETAVRPTWYALTRAMNMRFMRMPKPQVKLGETLPEHYR